MADQIEFKPIQGLNETSLAKLIEMSNKTYAEKAYVDNAVNNVTIDTSNLVTKTELGTEVENYLTENPVSVDTSNLVTKTELEEEVNNIVIDTNNLVAKERVDNISIDAYLFGLAKGENGKANNSTILQNLVDYVSSIGGGTIYIPQGTYYFKDKIIWKSNVNLLGAGVGLTVLKTFGGSEASKVEGYALIYSEEGTGSTVENLPGISNCYFKDFTINGAELHMTPSYKGKGIFFQKVINCTFKDLKFEGTGSTALGVDYLHHCVIDNVVCENCGRTWTMDSTIQGCAGIGIGTGGLPLENLVISNCQTYGCGQYGIFIEDQVMFGHGGQTPKGVTISNCITTNGIGHGIGVKGGENTIIANCHSYENAGYGINLKYASKKVKISDCIVTQNGLGGIGVSRNHQYYNINIDGCEIIENTGNGIDFAYGTSTTYDAATVKNITFKNNTIKSNTGHGVYVGKKNKIEGFHLDNNDIYENGNNGVEIEAKLLKTGSIKNNEIFNNSQSATNYAGLEFNGECTLGFLNIDKNNIYDSQTAKTQGYGIKFVGAGAIGSGNKFTDNILLNNKKSGIVCEYTVSDDIVSFGNVTTGETGKLECGTNGFAILPSQANIFDLTKSNSLIIDFQLSEVGIVQNIFSKKDINYNTDDAVRGIDIYVNADNKICMSGCTTNGGTKTEIVYNKVLAVDTRYRLKLTITSSTLTTQISTNGGSTYTTLSSESLTGGTSSDLIKAFATFYDVYLGKIFNGSTGFSSSFSGLIYYYKMYTEETKAEYNFFNFGKNKEVVDISGFNLNGNCYGGAKQSYSA